MAKLLFAGGGTGGHLYSGIAVAREAMRQDPATEVVFVGTAQGIEARVLPKEGLRLITLKMSGIKGRGLRSLLGIFRMPGALAASFSLLRRENPGAVVGIGGYASGPTVLAAALAGYPTAIIEQNVIPGFTNRMLARFVRRIYAPMEEAVARFPSPKKISVTGNPIRRGVVDEALGKAGVHTGPTKLLVFGGSLGATRINQAMVAALPFFKTFAGGISITHQTGEKDFEATRAAYQKELEGSAVSFDVRPYLHDMGLQYAQADVVLCRAGASTLSEVLAIGKAAILIPYPHAIYNHQELNARALQAQGAAKWIPDQELTGEKLFREVSALASDKDAMARMSAAAKAMGRPEAATLIAKEMLAMAGANPVSPSGKGSA